MLNELRIAVSGKSGCGNTTVSRMLADRLGVRLINYTFHNMAEERGMSFTEICRLAEEDTQYDLYLDQRQVEMVAQGSCVLGSRLAVWLLKKAVLKVFLTASPEVRAGRIARREGLPLQTALRNLRQRDRRDRQRYINLYQIDVDQYDFVDLVVDTERGDQLFVMETILQRLPENPGS